MKKRFNALTTLMKWASSFACLSGIALIPVVVASVGGPGSPQITLQALNLAFTFMGLTNLVSLISGFKDGHFLIFPPLRPAFLIQTKKKRGFTFWIYVTMNVLFLVTAGIFVPYLFYLR